MKRIIPLLLLTSVVLLNALLLTACDPFIETPPTQTRPLPTPTTVARSIAIPTDIEKMSPETDFFPPILHSDEFYPPIPVPGLVNTAGGEDSPFITPDGQTLYFWFTPDVRKPAQEQLHDGATGIYVTELVDGEWAQPRRVLLNQTGEVVLDGCPTVHKNTLWFCSARVGNERSIDFWTADITPDGYTNIQNAGSELNMGVYIGEMHVSADGNSIYFHSEQEGSIGGYDNWVTHFINGDWTAPQNLSSINSATTDGWPFISEDGQEFWFLREYNGYPGLFRSIWNGEDWGEPELIVSQFAGEPSLDIDGNLYFTHHFYNDGIMLDADIYVSYRK